MIRFRRKERSLSTKDYKRKHCGPQKSEGDGRSSELGDIGKILEDRCSRGVRRIKS